MVTGWTLKAKANTGEGDGKGFEKCPAGNHAAVMVAIIDVGTHLKDYEGKSSDKHMTYFVWELVNEPNAAGKNFLIAAELNFSFYETSRLRKWIENRLGRRIPNDVDYDIMQELGQPCMLSVVLGQKGWPRIENMAAVAKGMTFPKPQNPLFTWRLEEYKPGEPIDIPAWVPYHFGKPISHHIMQSKELFGEKDSQGPPPGTAPSAPPAPPRQQSAPPRNVDAPPPRPGATGKRYWVTTNPDAEPALMTEAEILKSIEAGTINGTFPACAHGTEAWRTVGEFFKGSNPF